MVIRCIRDTNSLNTQDDGGIFSRLDHIWVDGNPSGVINCYDFIYIYYN